MLTWGKRWLLQKIEWEQPEKAALRGELLIPLDDMALYNEEEPGAELEDAQITIGEDIDPGIQAKVKKYLRYARSIMTKLGIVENAEKPEEEAEYARSVCTIYLGRDLEETPFLKLDFAIIGQKNVQKMLGAGVAPKSHYSVDLSWN